MKNKIWITKHSHIPEGIYEYEIVDENIIAIRWDCILEQYFLLLFVQYNVH